MADITITAADLEIPVDAVVEALTADVALSVGDFVYFDTADQELKLSDAGASATAQVEYIVVRAAAADEIAIVLKLSKRFVLGGTLGAAGTQYVLSDTAGKICLLSDLTTGNEIVIVGYSGSTTELVPSLTYTGETVA